MPAPPPPPSSATPHSGDHHTAAGLPAEEMPPPAEFALAPCPAVADRHPATLGTLESYHGHLETMRDVLLVVDACRRGILARVTRRLTERHRNAIRSGSVFVWMDHEAGMKRWTDGKTWSPSRVQGSWLVYKECLAARELYSLQRQLAASFPATSASAASQDDDGENDSSAPDGSTSPVLAASASMIPASAPPSPMSAPRHLGDDSSTSMPSSPTVGASTTATSSRQTLRIRRGHRGNYAPLPDGLLKRTLSVPTTSGLVFHVVQYISEDVNNGHSDGTLLVPSDDPWLAQRGARLTSVPWDAYPHLDSSQVLAKLAGPVADSPQSDAPITEWPASASGPVQMPLAGGGAGRVRSASASSARTYGGSASGVPAVSGSFSISPPEAARQLSSSAPHFPSPLRPSFFAGPSSAFAAASAGNYSDDRRMQFPPPLPTPTSASFLQHHPSQYQYQYQQQQYQHQHYHSAPASSPLAPPMPPPDVPRTARAVPPRRSSDLPMMPEPQAMPSHWQLAPAPRRASVSPWSNGMPTVVHGTSAPRSPLRLQQQQQQQQYQHQLPHPFPGPMPAPNTASSSAATTTAYLAAPVSLARTARMASAPYPTPRSTEFPPPTPRRTPSYSSSPMALSPTMHHQQQPPLMGMPSSIGMGPAMPLEPPTTAATSMTTSPLSSPSMPPSSSRHILSSLTGGAAASAWSSFAARSALAPRPLGPSFARSTEALPRLWCPSNGEPAPREIMSSRSAGLGLEQARVYVPIVSSSSMAPPPPPTPLEPLYPLATSHGPVRPMAAAAASIGGMGVDHRGDGGADSGAHEAMDWAAPKDFPPPV